MYSHNLVKKFDLWWTVHFTGIAFDEEKLPKSKAHYAIIDTGTSLIYLPKSDYENFISKLAHIEQLDCSDKYDFCVSEHHECEEFHDKMGNFTIILDNVWYSIPPQGYTLSNE